MVTDIVYRNKGVWWTSADGQTHYRSRGLGLALMCVLIINLELSRISTSGDYKATSQQHALMYLRRRFLGPELRLFCVGCCYCRLCASTRRLMSSKRHWDV